MQNVSDRSWIKAFYDSAAEWWGESWYEGENLKPRLARVERFVGKPPKTLLELGAGTGETAAFLAAAGYVVTTWTLDWQFSSSGRLWGSFLGGKPSNSGQGIDWVCCYACTDRCKKQDR